ncbi:MAG: nuclear transport factor 2 family protein [Pseudomonadota bacterium]
MRLLVLCLLLGAVSARAADLPAGLVRALHDYDHAQFGNDVATLDRLVADDFMLVNSNASVENKAQFLADFNLPGFRIEPYVIEQPVHEVWRDGAVIGGLVNLRWTQGGEHQARQLRVAYVWVKRDGHWLAIYAQVTRVP